MTAKYTAFNKDGETIKEHEVSAWSISSSEDEDGICFHWPMSDEGDLNVDHQLTISDEALAEIGFVRAT